MTNAAFRKLALSFAETEESPHFEKASFRVNKKIFVTLNEKEKLACVKLSEGDQSTLSVMNDEIMYPVPNKWGKQGWTFIMLEFVSKEALKDALTLAYCHVAPKRLSEKYKQ